MRDPARIPIVLAKLKELWELNPDARLYQMISWITPPGKDPYFSEDDVALEQIERVIANHKTQKAWRDLPTPPD